MISVKETTILSVFHPDALALFNTCSDLKRVAHQLWDPTFRLNDKVCVMRYITVLCELVQDKHIRLFRCFAPMLCKRPTKSLEDAVSFMGGRKFFIEDKLDGERMQLHKKGNEFLYLSRLSRGQGQVAIY